MEETMNVTNTTPVAPVVPDIPVEDYNSSLMTNPVMPEMMSVEQAQAAAVSNFGWKEGAVLGFLVLGTAGIGYSLYDLGYKKLIKGVIIPKIAEKKAMREALKAGEQAAEAEAEE